MIRLHKDPLHFEAFVQEDSVRDSLTVHLNLRVLMESSRGDNKLEAMITLYHLTNVVRKLEGCPIL